MRFLPFRLLRLQNGQRRGNVRMNSRKITRFAFFFHSFAGQKLLSTRARHALEFRLVDMALLSIRYLSCEESLTPDSLINFFLFRRFFCAKFNIVCFFLFLDPLTRQFVYSVNRRPERIAREELRRQRSRHRVLVQFHQQSTGSPIR